MELVYRFSEMKDYRRFYDKFCIDTKLEENIDMCDYENLYYSADMLNEYLFYCHDFDIHFKFVGFDLEKINEADTLNNIKWKVIFEVLESFVKKYPNNTIEFVKE